MTCTTDELLRLHENGELVARYPDIARLLIGLSGVELRRAGQLLSRLDPEAVLRAHPHTPAIMVAVTGHGTLNALVPALTAELARHGILLRPVLSDFDSYVFDLGDPDSALYAAKPDLVLCVLDPGVVFDEVAVPWRPDDVQRVFDEKLALLERLAKRFTDSGHGTLVFNTVPLPRRRTSQLLDHRSRAALGALWREANAELLRLNERHGAVIVLDLDTLAAEGIQVTDSRLSVYSKAQLTHDLLAGYAREAAHLARHLLGRTKKVLALDLDDTVWGGILGDDGVDGIEVAEGYRGEAFREFQLTVKQLGSQGVLISAVSKNDSEPVRAALREHPAMTLRETDFVRVAANWRPKHVNLSELTADLNLGIDSVVFVDDSPYERGLVRAELPAVAVVDVDGEPALHTDRLLADGWFDTVELTTDDRDRPERYRDELVRKDFLHSFDSIQDYLRELGVAVRVAPATAGEIGRVSQITLRTNQFNLSTERLQPGQVRALAEHPGALVLALHASDRFGDNGLVGALFAHRDAGTTYIDNFLLSCRVFSRGVEQAALSALLSHARATGASSVVGTYRKTAKNGHVREFYPRNGFQRLSDDGTTATYRHDLAEIAPPPEHVHLTDDLGGSPT